jgi:hypothetical protein
MKQIGAPRHCPPNTASEAYNDALPVPNRANPMQRPADSGAVVSSKVPNLPKGIAADFKHANG